MRVVVFYHRSVRERERGLSDSERGMLMCGACATAHGWSPKNG
jgi:hypothetical protein